MLGANTHLKKKHHGNAPSGGPTGKLPQGKEVGKKNKEVVKSSLG